ncbi:transcription termination/antitermination protein NusG [Rhizorhabdus sp. FW153]|uniref:transcription termination/antitermination protein NusG n=1 Tax=Rhizorhabdus sp. FW153 TaxID=3400216 RepID=UPI003CF83E8F
MDRPEMSRPWYVAQLKPNAGAIAERNLRRQGFELFVPQERCAVRGATAFRTVRRPLFPGYVFVRAGADMVVPSAALRAVNGTQGIVRLVSFGANPAPLPPGFVEALIDRYDEGGRMAPPPPLREGDRVRMASAPFVDMIGSIEKVGAERRVWILLDLLGTKVRLSASSDDLALVG